MYSLARRRLSSAKCCLPFDLGKGYIAVEKIALMKLLVSLSLLLLFGLPISAQGEYLELPWSSLGNCEMAWISEGEEKNTWALILNEKDRVYYSAYHHLLNFSAEQIMQRLAKSIQPNYYLARFTIMKNTQGHQNEPEQALFAIESKEYIPTGKPLTTIYMVAMGKEKSYIVSVDLPTHKLNGKDKKKWKAFFSQARINQGDLQDIMASLQ